MDIGFKVLICLAITDFLSGFFHWLEDRYGDLKWPVVGKHVIFPNIVHHLNGRNFVFYSWFRSARVLLVIGAFVIIISHLSGVLNWMIWLIVLIGVNANEVHKWSHRSESENGVFVTILQKLRLIQMPSHHLKHHRLNKDTHYCILTNFLNPILDTVKLWRGMEQIIFKITKVSPRNDKEAFREILSLSLTPNTN